MVDERPYAPNCPSCGKLMRLTRAELMAGNRPELRTYDCRQCGVAVSEAEAFPQKVRWAF
jgi:predicted RNA-binding Zn-ribbon protein involved in translation (DUF1610 family)